MGSYQLFGLFRVGAYSRWADNRINTVNEKFMFAVCRKCDS